MNIAATVCIIILIIGLFKPVRFLMSVSWAFAAFGSLAVLPTDITGGVSLIAGTVGTFFVFLRIVSLPGGFAGVLNACTDGRRLRLLTLFTIVAVFGAALLPIAFQGAVEVFPMRLGAQARPEPLASTTANFTQSAYLMVSFLVAAAYCWLARQPRFIHDFGWAVLVGASAVVTTGLLDMVTRGLGIGDVLSVFRTASYAFIADAEVQGVKRTIGLMPEASAFGSLSAFYFAQLLFTRGIYSPAIRSRIVMPLIVASGAFALLSTSSTAYVMIIATIGLFICCGISGAVIGKAANRARHIKELTFVGIALIFLFFVAMFFDQTREALYTMFDQTVLQKTQSASYIERSSWTNLAFDAWLNTGGLGVGVGSVRTSNLFVNILASTGFPGFCLFFAFLIKVYSLRSWVKDERVAELIRGSKLALVPSLLGASVAGTTPDYGGINAALFGIIVGGASFGYARSNLTSQQRSTFKDRTSTAS